MGLLSWWRGRGEAADAADTGMPSEAGPPAGSPGSPSPEPSAAPVREAPAWPHLTPVQRTLSSPGLTIDPTGFQGSLTTRQDTMLGSPLGHLVDPEAPSGLGHGIAEATAQRTTDDLPSAAPGGSSAAPAMPMASSGPPARRSVVFPAAPSGVPLQRATAASMVESAHTHAGPPLHVPYAPTPPGGFEPPVAGLPAEPPGDPGVPDGPAGVVEANPVPAVQTAPAARETPDAPPDAPDVSDDAPTDEVPSSSGSAADRAVTPEPPAEPAPPAMPVQRARAAGGADGDTSMSFRPGPHSAQRTPLGLGAPLNELPPTAQRSAAARSGPDAPSALPVPTDTDAYSEGSGTSGDPASGADIAGAPGDAGDAGDASGALPVAPLLGDSAPLASPGDTDAADATADVQRTDMRQNDGPHADVQRAVDLPMAQRDAAGSATGAATGPDTTAASAPRFASPPPSLLPPPSPLPVVPLIAQRSVPLFSGAQAPGEALGGASPGSSGGDRAGTGPAASAPAVVPVRWETAGSGGGPAVQRSADAGASDATPQVTATASYASYASPTVSPGGGLDVSLGSAGLPASSVVVPLRSATGPAVQRTVGLPAPGAFPNAGDAAVAAGVGRRTADGSVVFDLPMQREEEGETGVAPEPAPDLPTPDQPTATGLPAPPRDLGPPEEGPPDSAAQPPGDGHAAAPGSAGDGKPPVVNDELVRALYTPLSRMLRADLRLERERAGFLIDTRH